MSKHSTKQGVETNNPAATKSTKRTPARPSRKSETDKQIDQLLRLASGVELFHSVDDRAFATVPVNTHQETFAVASQAFHDWLIRGYYLELGSVPGQSAINSAVELLRAQARYSGPKQAVHIRTAEHQGNIYLNLGGPKWEVAEINTEGWRIRQTSPVKFWRPRGMAPLPMPAAGGDLNELQKFVNYEGEDEWRLIVGWLVAGLLPKGPYPIAVLHGEQGSAKSTTARVLRSLIDPNVADLRAEPRDLRDLSVMASNGWVVPLDNLSRLPEWLSDALCRIATGAGFSTRELYTDDQERIFELQRPIILNGIEELATRGDLLERSIVFDLPPITELGRKTEEEFWKEFEQARPRILGALLDTVAAVLRERDHIVLPALPRLADFVSCVSAAEGHLGWHRGSFLETFRRNRASANDIALDASVITPGLKQLAAEGPWTGTATELLAQLNSRTSENTRRARGWPSSARALSGSLKRLAPNLRQVGINMDHWRETDHDRNRMIRIYQDSPLPSDASDDGEKMSPGATLSWENNAIRL